MKELKSDYRGKWDFPGLSCVLFCCLSSALNTGPLLSSQVHLAMPDGLGTKMSGVNQDPNGAALFIPGSVLKGKIPSVVYLICFLLRQGWDMMREILAPPQGHRA